MLNILLLILKIIGIILLCVLGLIILVLLLLCIPVRYRVKFEKNEAQMKLNAKVTWLFKLITFDIGIIGNDRSKRLKIFGIPLGKKKMPDRDADNEDHSESKNPGAAKISESVINTGSAAEPMSETESEQSKRAEIRINHKAETDFSVAAEDGKASEQTENRDSSSAPKDKKRDPDTFFEKEKSRGLPVNPEAADKKKKKASGKTKSRKEEKSQPGKTDGKRQDDPEKKDLAERAMDTLDSVFDRVEKLTDKLNDRKLNGKIDFLTDDRTLNAVGFALILVKKLLRHILPHKGNGFLQYGLSDPAATGWVLALIAATRHHHRDEIEVIPDFSGQILICDAGLEGRVNVMYILAAALCTVLRKDVLFVIKNYKKHF